MNINAKYVMLDIANKTGNLKPIVEKDRKTLVKILTNMIYDIQTVCEANGITIMASYGTALGAYRHKGFIPWDDDADICMLRHDWEKLRDNFETLFQGKYILEAPLYGIHDTQMTWGKIYLPETKYVEIFNEGAPYNKGVFLDVFVIDYLSDNSFVRSVDMFIAKHLKSAINSIAYYKYAGKNLTLFMSSTFGTKIYFNLRKLLGVMMSIRSHKAWCDTYDKFVSRHKNTKFTISNYSGIITPASEWLPAKKMQFEDIQINVPNNIEKYLERAYGKNYMQLPPKEKREQHFCVELDFGKYK